MHRVVDSDTYWKHRNYAKFHKKDPAAEETFAALSKSDQRMACKAPLQVGEVDFGKWDDGDERVGTLRRLPIYIHKHDDHIFECYPAGFPGSNERVTCHCGFAYYFAKPRGLKALFSLLRPQGISQNKNPAR